MKLNKLQKCIFQEREHCTVVADRVVFSFFSCPATDFKLTPDVNTNHRAGEEKSDPLCSQPPAFLVALGRFGYTRIGISRKRLEIPCATSRSAGLVRSGSLCYDARHLRLCLDEVEGSSNIHARGRLELGSLQASVRHFQDRRSSSGVPSPLAIPILGSPPLTFPKVSTTWLKISLMIHPVHALSPTSYCNTPGLD